MDFIYSSLELCHGKHMHAAHSKSLSMGSHSSKSDTDNMRFVTAEMSLIIIFSNIWGSFQKKKMDICIPFLVIYILHALTVKIWKLPVPSQKKNIDTSRDYEKVGQMLVAG